MTSPLYGEIDISKDWCDVALEASGGYEAHQSCKIARFPATLAIIDFLEHHIFYASPR